MSLAVIFKSIIQFFKVGIAARKYPEIVQLHKRLDDATSMTLATVSKSRSWHSMAPWIRRTSHSTKTALFSTGTAMDLNHTGSASEMCMDGGRSMTSWTRFKTTFGT